MIGLGVMINMTQVVIALLRIWVSGGIEIDITKSEDK